MYTSVVCGIISNQYIYQETQLNQDLNDENYNQTTFNPTIAYKIRPVNLPDIYLEIVSEDKLDMFDVLATLYDCEEDFKDESTYYTLINNLTNHFLNIPIKSHLLQPYKQLGSFKSIDGTLFRYTYLDGEEPYAIMKSEDTTWETCIEYVGNSYKVRIKCGDTLCQQCDIEFGNEEKFLKHVALSKLYATLGLRKR